MPLRRQLEKSGQLFAVRGVHGASPHGEIMPIHCDIAAVYGDDGSHQRSPIQIGTPILVQNMGLIVCEESNALPDSHSVLEVLTLTARRAGRDVGHFPELGTAA